MFPRPSNFGAPLAPAVAKGLEDARSRMEPCFDEEVARENARPSGQRASAAEYRPGAPRPTMQGHLDALEVVDTDGGTQRELRPPSWAAAAR